jgi:hypothetical protein
MNESVYACCMWPLRVATQAHLHRSFKPLLSENKNMLEMSLGSVLDRAYQCRPATFAADCLRLALTVLKANLHH